MIGRAFLKRARSFNKGETGPESNGIIAGVYFLFFLYKNMYLARMRKQDYDINVTDKEQIRK